MGAGLQSYLLVVLDVVTRHTQSKSSRLYHDHRSHRSNGTSHYVSTFPLALLYAGRSRERRGRHVHSPKPIVADAIGTGKPLPALCVLIPRCCDCAGGPCERRGRHVHGGR
jgi:hypothetical protein